MKSSGKWIIIFILLLGYIFIAGTAAIFAFEVGPGKADFTVTAGKLCTKEFFITNSEDKPIEIGVTLEDQLRIMPEAVDLKEGTETAITKNYPLSKYSKVYPDNVSIAPKETKKINLEITMPEDATGEYYGSIFFEAMPPKLKGKTTGVGISKRLGMALYVAIEGTEIFKCEFGRFEVLSVNPLRFKLDVKNLGNVHIRPKGYAIFKNKKDGQKIRLELNVISAPILPNMELDIGIKKGDDGLAPGEYTAFIHLEYGKNGVLNKEFKSKGVRPTH